MRAVGRFDLARRIVPARTRVGGQAGSTVFHGVDVDAVVVELERDGLSRQLRLPPSIVEDITAFAHSAMCYGDRDLECGFKYAERPAAVLTAAYVNAAQQCDAIRTLSGDAKLLEVAARYLRCEDPALQSANLTWSFPVEASERQRSLAAQVFHYDRDDYRFLKFFFYVTDVGPGDGPHVCVLGTHRRKRFADQIRPRRRSDDYVSRTYGRDNVVTILGPAGFGFAEDTRCFHKGVPPTTGDRLLFQLAFARNDYGVLQDDPVNMHALRAV